MTTARGGAKSWNRGGGVNPIYKIGHFPGHMIYKEKTVSDHMWLLNEIRVTFDSYVGLTYRIWLLWDFTMWGGSDSIKW